MKGIDIIEAFGGIDNDLLLDAKRHKKSAPRWLKWASLAACLCCVTALTVLSLSRLTAAPESQGTSFGTGAPTPVPEAPALPPDSEESALEPTPTPTPEPTPTPTPEAQPTPTPAPDRDYLELTSDQYQLTLYAPADYASEITMHSGLLDMEHDVVFSDLAFTFVDTFNQTQTFPGRLWCIAVYRQDTTYRDPVPTTSDGTALYTHAPLGTKDGNVYELIYFSPTTECDMEDPTAVFSYYCHLTDGLTMLDDFITRNGLEEYPLWRDTYQEKTITRAEAVLNEFEEDYLSGVDPSTLRTYQSERTGLTLELPEDMLPSIVEGDAPAIFSLYEPISQELLGNDGGLVWTIYRYTTEEYLETYHCTTTAFSKTPLTDSLDYLLGRSYSWDETVDYVYVIHFPTDVRYDPNSQESTEAYQHYEAQSTRILKHFLTDNNIEANPYWSIAVVHG